MNTHNNFVRANDPNLYQRGFNQNLNGMNTQFQNSNMMHSNAPNQNEAFQKYNVIPNKGPQYTLINKKNRIICVVNNKGTLKLNNIFKDVSKVQLLSALKLDTSGNTAGVGGIDASGGFYSLHINEFSGRGKYGDVSGAAIKTLDSFATLDINSDSNYLNQYNTNRDEVTFDPPLNGLDSLTFSLYDRYGNPEDSLRNIKYEFIIETVSKIRNY